MKRPNLTRKLIAIYGLFIVVPLISLVDGFETYITIAPIFIGIVTVALLSVYVLVFKNHKEFIKFINLLEED